MSSLLTRTVRFVRELRRRRVVRNVLAYGALSLVVIEASDNILPPLGAPEGSVRWVILACIVGLPAVIVLSWVYDITEGRIVRTEAEPEDDGTPATGPAPGASEVDTPRYDRRQLVVLPFDDLKLVTHCLDDPGSSERIIREYLIYRIYQMLSPYHCRVQLVRVRYADEDRSRPDEVHIGMLIEEDRMRANRLGLSVADTLNLHYGNFPANMPDVHSLFQYLIGNTDWSLVASRNLEMLRDEKTGLFYMIPFDFDFSGLVNAPYALPNPDYRLTNIRQRVYLGPQPPSEQARMQVLSVKKEVLKFIRKFPHLSGEAKADIIEYLNSGFGDIKRNKLALPGQG